VRQEALAAEKLLAEAGAAEANTGGGLAVWLAAARVLQ
jgi:hypothetical protein